jgi:hypothetical protein
MKEKQDDREFFENVVGFCLLAGFATVVVLGFVAMFRALV